AGHLRDGEPAAQAVRAEQGARRHGPPVQLPAGPPREHQPDHPRGRAGGPGPAVRAGALPAAAARRPDRAGGGDRHQRRARSVQPRVKVVGTIPTGLPGVSWPHLKLGDLWVLLPSAAGMMLVIFSEALGAGQTFADKHGYRLESSQEMIALGLANLGSGVLGGLACGGSLSQSAVNDGAGARTELSPIIAAALSLVTVVALTPLFTDLPEAVLAALIIH